MAQLISFKVKGVDASFEASLLTPEVAAKMLAKGCARSFFERETGKEDKTAETLTAAIAKMTADPNAYYAAIGTRGEGTTRAKLSPLEKEAKNRATKIVEYAKMDASKLEGKSKAVIEGAQAIWAKYGGSGFLFKAKDDVTDTIKAAVQNNLAAKQKVFEAYVAKLTAENWAPKAKDLEI